MRDCPQNTGTSNKAPAQTTSSFKPRFPKESKPSMSVMQDNQNEQNLYRYAEDETTGEAYFQQLN
jgi:hypothetical protein